MFTKYDKEKYFHNRFFKKNTRKSLDKFYSIDKISDNFYNNCILQNSIGKSVLELGCGRGINSIIYAKNASMVIGIDISDIAIKQAIEYAKSKKINNVSFFEMNAEFFNFPNRCFDIICGKAILHHLNLKRAIDGINNHLKAGGKAVFIEPLGQNHLINLFRKLTPNLRTEDEHPLLMKDLDLLKSNFDKSTFQFFHLFTFFAILFQKLACFNKLLIFLAKIDEFMFNKVPFFQKYAWIVVIKLKK